MEDMEHRRDAPAEMRIPDVGIDRLGDVLEKHRDHLARSIELLEKGHMVTSTHGLDTTAATIAQFQIWMADISSALFQHNIALNRRRGRKA